METIQKAGGARQLGISNCYDLELMKRLYGDAIVKPTVLQNRFYQETGYDQDLRHWCSNQEIVYQSIWTLTANPHILSSNSIQTIAEKYLKTEAQVFFRFLSQIGIVPLTGTCTEQHMMEDLSIFDFELSVDDIENLRSLLKQL